VRKFLAAAFFASVVVTGFSEAQAMPIAPLQQDQAAQGQVIQVFGGCGPGWHRGPYGGLPSALQLPSRVAHGAIWSALLPQLVINGQACGLRCKGAA
jgi:hypothetical protein